jgi:hypothetical protein
MYWSYTDYYSYVLYATGIKGNVKREDRNPMDLLQAHYKSKAKEKAKKLQEEYDKLQLDDWDRFACWVDMQVGTFKTPEQMGQDLGLSPATIRKRLSILGVPKFNGNESNPFGKRFIPDHIYDILKEELEEWKGDENYGDYKMWQM